MPQPASAAIRMPPRRSTSWPRRRTRRSLHELVRGNGGATEPTRAGKCHYAEASHYFVYDNGTYTTLNVASASFSSAPNAINDRGEVVGAGPGVGGGFIYDDGSFTMLNVPGAAPNVAGGVSTAPEAINNRGEVAGYYVDSSRTEHGFVYDNGKYTTLNVPGSTSTSAVAINDRGEVVGTYGDPTATGGEQGFLATPQSGEATMAGFGELVSAHARHVGVNDLLPGVPGIRGGSPHAANARGMMDQTAAAGPRFASFSGLAGDQTVTQVLLHGNDVSLGAG